MYIRAASQILCCKVTVFSGLCNDFEQILVYKLQLRYSRAYKYLFKVSKNNANTTFLKRALKLFTDFEQRTCTKSLFSRELACRKSNNHV